MEDQKVKILDAAISVFMRYGVGRTRMGDIAKEAGIVRQTLYHRFKNKDEILCAAICHYADQSLQQIEAAWADLDKLEDKLDIFHDLAVLSSYAVINASADARDMVGGYNEAGKAEIIKAQSRKIAAWKECLEDHPLPKNSTHDAKQLASYIVLGAFGLRDQASSEKQLKMLLNLHKQTILSFIIHP